MQDEIIFKNGEIKVLRDSMQQLESTMEEQRRSNMLLEKEKTQTLNEKEREFSKKVCEGQLLQLSNSLHGKAVFFTDYLICC